MLKRENPRIFRQWLPPFHDGRENQLLFNRLFMIVPAEFRKQGGGIQVSCARIIERPPLEAKSSFLGEADGRATSQSSAPID
jgi:hypothetical protein